MTASIPRVLLAASLCAAALTVGSTSAEGRRADPATQPAELMPRASRTLVLDVVQTTSRGVAVGERGHVLVSESRRDWRQVPTPTRSTLTAAAAIGDRVWAVGHDGVIIHSEDGGMTWTLQRVASYDPDSEGLHNGTPLLDVYFFDASNGLAVGAYAQLLRTSDGGRNWSEQTLLSDLPAPAATSAPAPSDEDDESWTFDAEELELEAETEPHLNGIARTGDGSLFIVAERGAAFRSTDGGYRWERIQLPYEGSMFGVIAFEGRHVLAFGLRGNVFESTDLGDTWRAIDTGTDLSLMGGTGWAGGGATLVGANGVILSRGASGDPLVKRVHPDQPVFSSVVALAPLGELVLAGELGIEAYTPN